MGAITGSASFLALAKVSANISEMERLKPGESLNNRLSYNVDCPWSSTIRLPRALTVVVTIHGAGGYPCFRLPPGLQKKLPEDQGATSWASRTL